LTFASRSQGAAASSTMKSRPAQTTAPGAIAAAAASWTARTAAAIAGAVVAA